MKDACIAPAPAPAAHARCPHPRAPGSLFCRGHEQAPAAQRGGWLSAERRRRTRMGARDEAWDVSNVAQRLWVGVTPPWDRDLPSFDLLALCAPIVPSQPMPFRGRVLRCPVTPGEISIHQIQQVLGTSAAVARSLRGGGTVLVTCATGHHGAALVAGLGLGFITRLGSGDIVAILRQRRSPECLADPQLARVLDFYLSRRR